MDLSTFEYSLISFLFYIIDAPLGLIQLSRSKMDCSGSWVYFREFLENPRILQLQKLHKILVQTLFRRLSFLESAEVELFIEKLVNSVIEE